ncbi:hypothetical protein [Microcystis aeruginosa]|nr:hypothetical protein [Microcystis aeruginosa]
MTTFSTPNRSIGPEPLAVGRAQSEKGFYEGKPDPTVGVTETK